MADLKVFYVRRSKDLLPFFHQGVARNRHTLGTIVFPSTTRDAEVENTFRKKTETGNVI